MRAFFDKQVNKPGYDKQLVSRLVEKNMVYDNRLKKKFELGLEIDVEG